MKKYLSFVLVLSLVFVLGFSTFFEETVHAEPVDGGAGTASDIGKVTCITKSKNTVGPALYSYRVNIGTAGNRFYVTPGSTVNMTLHDPSSSTTTEPKFNLVSGSGFNTLYFYLTTGISYNVASPLTIEIQGVENIHTLSKDGTKYYPFDWSALNDPATPACQFVPGSGGTASGTIIGGDGTTPGDTYVPPTGTPSCSDGIQNQGETGVDTGGPCSSGTSTTGTCSDGIQNQNETGVDTGGVCAPIPSNSGTCTDGIKNGNETGIDTGGSCEGGILSPGTNHQQPVIEHIKGTGKPIQVNWQNINAPEIWQQYFVQAKKDWNLVRALQISLNGPGYTVPMYVDSYPEDWIGAASYYVAGGGHQLNTKVEFNKRMMDAYNLWTPAYLSFLVCHELGHSIGAGHADVNNNNANLGTCMDYSRNPGGGGAYGPLNNMHPSRIDIEALSAAYAHVH